MAEGPGSELSTALRLLAVGVDPRELPEKLGNAGLSRAPRATHLSLLADARAALASGPVPRSTLSGFRDKTLLPPGDRLMVHIAPDVLCRIARETLATLETSEAAGPVEDPLTSTALQFAETKVRSGEVSEWLGRLTEEAAPLHTGLAADADRRRLEEWILYRAGRGRRVHSLDQSLGRWEQFVSWLESSAAPPSREEIEDRLDARDDLETMRDLLVLNTRDAIDERLEAIDRRYIEATAPRESDIQSGRPWRPSSWWWHRVPR